MAPQASRRFGSIEKRYLFDDQRRNCFANPILKFEDVGNIRTLHAFRRPGLVPAKCRRKLLLVQSVRVAQVFYGSLVAAVKVHCLYFDETESFDFDGAALRAFDPDIALESSLTSG